MHTVRTFRRLSVALFAAAAIGSPALAHETPEELANEQVVLDFYAALNEGDATGTTKERIADIAEKYLSPDYTQHSEQLKNLPGEGSDRDKLIRMFQSMPAMPGPAPSPPTTVAIMSEGDLVMMLTSREMTNPATGKTSTSYIFNMFRVKDGKLTEHWDGSSGGGAGGPPSGAGGPPGGMPPGGPPPGGN